MIDFEKKLATIPEVEPDEIDLQLIAEAKEDDSEGVSLESIRQEREYNGKILIRIPKDLHRDLIHLAEEQGVSLNQYCLYKLAQS